MSSINSISFVQHSSDPVASRVWGLNWNSTGKNLVTCGEDKSVKIWKLNSEKLELIQKIAGDQTRAIRYAHFSSCGKYLATGSWDATVIIYEYVGNEFEEKHKLEGHDNEIKCCQFSPSGAYFATCSRDKTVWVWEVDEDGDYEVLSILQRHSGDVKFVLWHPEYDLLISGGYDNALRMYYYDGDDWVSAQDIEGAHGSTIWSASFDPSGRYMVSVCAEHVVKIWELTSPMPTSSAKLLNIASYEIKDTVWPLYSVSWNPLNNLIAIGGGDQYVRLLQFDEESKAVLPFLSLKLDSEINSLSWNPTNDSLLAAALDDGTVQLVNVSV
uniref:Probable cytosolic iron-sulfur protein assembly protein CIAO1 homolog n=1 Tax=Panagrolaimus superbus TaxID=310955 RepID=A0A914YQC5_9BILA